MGLLMMPLQITLLSCRAAPRDLAHRLALVL
jgi:hypothetical protein